MKFENGRLVIACRFCKKKHLRCNAGKPCDRCTRLKKKCVEQKAGKKSNKILIKKKIQKHMDRNPSESIIREIYSDFSTFW